jgi:hypothetical protein
MNKALNPLVLAGIAAVTLVILVAVGWHMLQPTPYTPSPGVVSGSRSGDPGSAKAMPDGGAGPSNGTPGQSNH